jgi:flagellar export protein FliJ
MPKFEFRLDTVLRLREREEDEMKQAYQAAVARRIEADQSVEDLRAHRQTTLVDAPLDLETRRNLAGLLEKFDDDEQALITADLLQQEEESALRRYHLAKQAAEALRKLRAGRLAEWELSEQRAEQAALDEWAVQRRLA